MRKISLLLLFATILAGFSVSCSSDEDYFYEQDESAKLEYTKSLIASYGQKYGLDNIQFDDELLKKNLNLPKEEFEKCVINMAISLGKIKPTSKLLRKTRRSSSIASEEPGGSPDYYYYISGSHDLSYSSGSYLCKYTAIYLYIGIGFGALEILNNNADVYKMELCDNPNCKIMHEVFQNKTTCTRHGMPNFLGSITHNEGEFVNFTIKCNVDISDIKDNILYEFYVTTRVKKSDTYPTLTTIFTI